jgi:hypothetical protein
MRFSALTVALIASAACGHRREDAAPHEVPPREGSPPPAPPPPVASKPPPPTWSEEDRATLAPAYAFLERATHGTDEAEQSRLALEGATKYMAALLVIGKRHPDDFAIQYQVASALEMLGGQVEGLGGDGKPACTEALAFTRDLVARFEQEARAHGVRAFTLNNCNEDPQEVLVAAARCVELAPDNQHCRDLHARTAALWQAPRCTGAAIAPGVRVFGAGPRGRQRDAAPAITAADFAEIKLVDGTAVGELNPAGHDHFRTLTARLATEKGTVVIAAGGEVLATLDVEHEITSPRMNLITDDLGKVCATIERRTIPAAAQIRTGSK